MKESDRRQASSVAAADRSCPSASSAAIPRGPTATPATTATGCTTANPPACDGYYANWKRENEKNAFTFHQPGAKHDRIRFCGQARGAGGRPNVSQSFHTRKTVEYAQKTVFPTDETVVHSHETAVAVEKS